MVKFMGIQRILGDEIFIYKYKSLKIVVSVRPRTFKEQKLPKGKEAILISFTSKKPLSNPDVDFALNYLGIDTGLPYVSWTQTGITKLKMHFYEQIRDEVLI